MSDPVGYSYKPRGLVARAKQLGELLQQQRENKRLQREARPGEGFTGTVATRNQLVLARNALRRQIRVAAGLPASRE